MCGIAGIWNPSQKITQHKEILKNMLARIHYRGPDECGMLTSGHLLMGNVRLNIIDPEGGTQPLCDQTERYWIVFNGEIFNYIELREVLKKKGCRFKTQSDTEVLVQLYALYGEKALNKLNGQFAFAIWDKKTGSLFLARDHVGIRPLYYSWYKGTFLFGSEIKSILQFYKTSPEINPRALHQIFTFWAPLSPNTIFKDVYEVPPGHFLTIKKGKTEVKKYWQLNFSQTRDMNLSETMEEFNELLYDSVRLRLRSDVPVAAYLSGGIDSTATTRFIKEIQPQNLQTFSIGFEENQYDETNYQSKASKYLDTTHKQFICNNESIAEYFSKIIWHTEVPVIRTAPAPMYFLSRLVKKNDIKVVITGEGADEMLAGYNIFKETLIRNFWAKYPDSKYRPLLLKKLYPYIPYMANASPGMLKMFFGYRLEDTSSPFYSHLIRWNNTSKIKNFFSPELLNGHASYNPQEDIYSRLPDDFNTWTPLAKSQLLEINLFMSGYLLSSQGDRMAMANSVEGRYPFLDRRIMEYTASLPDNFKLNGLTEKFLLKKLMKDKIPSDIVKRSKQA
ncbi:MAG: asparagine synthase (glutamine-hydrolyzing), partial [Bacteroidales bacterium]|nr:asparagine synthase (glutamine-hydrolyzing) [Bacteroidales bacterium]